MKILAALSGGIDSSVMAHLLKREGHEVIGVMMRLWMDPLAPAMEQKFLKKCCSIEHIQRARDVCTSLGIPFYVLNAEEDFKREVIDPFLEGYRRGETPNPCIDCNRKIKFGMLLQKVREFGCDKIATGHYARIREEDCEGKSIYRLFQGIDTPKDQSYYLYALTQEDLRHIVFPLGEKKKSEIYALASAFGVSIPSWYRESQDLCFYPEKSSEPFLRRYLSDALKPGDIRLKDETVVGTHRGLPFYTSGQRKGLGIGGLKIPLHVTKKDPGNNVLYVAPDGDDLKYEICCSSMHWISQSPDLKQNNEFSARISSLGRKVPGTLKVEGNRASFRLEQPMQGVAPGQSLVLYNGEEVVGGGVISNR